MLKNPATQYRPFPPIQLPDRQWPNFVITVPPIWCSVDLRDGNQALAVPMTVNQKLDLFIALVCCGFKEIEVGFPAASNTEYEFVRLLIEGGHIPDDVTIQVLVQAREDLIERTIQSLIGAKRVIIHLYNSTSPAQRRIVFGLEKPAIKQIAVQGTRWVKDRVSRLVGTDVLFQYSPESFSATEVEFALEVCEAVAEVWQPTPERKIIFNLPDTVEVAMPNVYADQIEWFIRHLRCHDCAIISLHTHNDRGTGIAKTELGLLAGADRVEGTLFGNGERTGNCDLVTVAMNLYAQGIDPGLDFGHIGELIGVYERCTGMTVPPRQPYAGELVFTAFSGSHQDAIRKGLLAWGKQTEGGREAIWDIPYLTIDPHDIGREYREVIRVNSQSGKGGVAYLLESEFGINLPKSLQREFGPIVNDAIDRLGREVTGAELKTLFWHEYVDRTTPWLLVTFTTQSDSGLLYCQACLTKNETEVRLFGRGNGPIDAFVHAFTSMNGGVSLFEVVQYSEHSLGVGEGAMAISYIQIRLSDGTIRWGAGVDTSIELASIKAVLSALNRLSVISGT